MTSASSFSQYYKLGIKMVTQLTWFTASSTSSKKQLKKRYYTGDNPFNDIEAIPSVLDSINNCAKSLKRYGCFRVFLTDKPDSLSLSPYTLLPCCSLGRLPDSYSRWCADTLFSI